MKPKILICGMDEWSHGRVYWDLVNVLGDAYTFDYVNWCQHFHDLDWLGLSQVYAAVLIDMNTALEYLDTVFARPEIVAKILPINHGPQQVADYTFMAKQTRLANYVDREMLRRDLDIFKLIACVSPNTVHSVKKEAPSVAAKLRLTTLGVNPNNFPMSTFLRTNLRTAGYFTHVNAAALQGFDTKRGHLAQTACAQAGVPLLIKNDVSFRCMDLWYQKIDVYLMSSIYESGPLPMLEAGVCGVPIIAAPAGLAPQFLQNGGGVLSETFDEAEYVKLARNTLQFWRENPTALSAESKIIREHTLEKHSWSAVRTQWSTTIDEFLAL